MLEIIILFRLCKRIGHAARNKGGWAIGYQLLLVLFWFVGEFGSAVLAAILLYLAYGQEFRKCLFLAYVAAFAGAGLGAWLAFRIVETLPEPGIDELGSSIADFTRPTLPENPANPGVP